MPHVNVALQILPMAHENHIAIIEAAIAVIQASGLKHLVCPFETVIEGEYDEVMALVKHVQGVCIEQGATNLLANLKIHQFAHKSAHIDDKLAKYRPL